MWVAYAVEVMDQHVSFEHLAVYLNVDLAKLVCEQQVAAWDYDRIEWTKMSSILWNGEIFQENGSGSFVTMVVRQEPIIVRMERD